MATVTVTIPKMLAELVRNGRTHSLAGRTVREALDALCGVYPELQVHMFDESGSLRPHVSCFHNDRTVHDLDTALAEGDRIVVLQAVSGG